MITFLGHHRECRRIRPNWKIENYDAFPHKYKQIYIYREKESYWYQYSNDNIALWIQSIIIGLPLVSRIISKVFALFQYEMTINMRSNHWAYVGEQTLWRFSHNFWIVHKMALTYVKLIQICKNVALISKMSINFHSVFVDKIEIWLCYHEASQGLGNRNFQYIYMPRTTVSIQKLLSNYLDN